MLIVLLLSRPLYFYIVCPSNISITVGSNGQATITTPSLLAYDGCGGEVNISQVDGPHPGDVLVTSTLINATMTFSATTKMGVSRTCDVSIIFLEPQG